MKIAVLFAAFLTWPLVNSIRNKNIHPDYYNLVQINIIFCVLLFLHNSLYFYKENFQHFLEKISYDLVQPFVGILFTIFSFHLLCSLLSLNFNADKYTWEWNIKILMVVIGLHNLTTMIITGSSLYQQLERFPLRKTCLNIFLLIAAVISVAIRRRTLVMKEERSDECVSVYEYWRDMYYRMMLLIPSSWICLSVDADARHKWWKLKGFLFIISYFLIIGVLIGGFMYGKFRSLALEQGHFERCNEHLQTAASFFILDSFIDIPSTVAVLGVVYYWTCCLGCSMVMGIFGAVKWVLSLIFPNNFKGPEAEYLLNEGEEVAITNSYSCI